MKRVVILFFVLFLVTACSFEDKEKLYVYNWGEYIDEALVREFEKEYDVKVVYERFNSNEQMYQKLQDGSAYDVLLPSDYMIERLIAEDYLQKLDFNQIPNAQAVAPFLLEADMDPLGEYSVPYFWGNVGILYNKDRVELKDLERDGWNSFLNQKYKGQVYFYDSERDAFMVALKALNYSSNSHDQKELNQAYLWLESMIKQMDPVFSMDEIVDNMHAGIKDIGLVYSGDANLALMDSQHLGYFVPKEGTNLWIDAFVIPKNAPNSPLAHQWIDFMMRETSLKANSIEVGYTVSDEKVMEELTEKGQVFSGVESYIVPMNREQDEFFRHDEKLKKIMSEYWQKVKTLK